MAAATAGYEWPQSSPTGAGSSDTASPVFPDRPIRPLPKRRLRARLSPEQADSIIFPQAPSSSAQLFSFPYSQVDGAASSSSRSQRPDHHHHDCECQAVNPSELESEEDDDGSLLVQASPTLDRAVTADRNARMTQRLSKTGSVASSADGYDSFENTSNKKKRKIPNTANGSSIHHANLTAEMAGMGLSHGRHSYEDGEEGSGQTYGSNTAGGSPSGTGIAGAGRGRYARRSMHAQERRPLGTSMNAMNAYANGHNGMLRHENIDGVSCKNSSVEGIISTAIANAQSQTSPSTNENISVVQQHAKIPPKAGQFTFTVESESANRMIWPGQNGAYPTGMDSRSYDDGRQLGSHVSNQETKRASQGTQTGHPNAGTNRTSSGQAALPPAPYGSVQAPQGELQEPRERPRKPRRRPSKEYALAARQRQVQQEYANWHRPPAREDIWICEFCEYTSIFGAPPEALIRQYEIKDKKERKRLAEKRRLLEKARMKNKKGKKGAKNGKNNNNNAQQPAAPNGTEPTQAGHQQPQDDDMRTHYDEASQGEDYYEDELEDNSDDLQDVDPPPQNYHPPTTAGAAQYTQPHGGGGGKPHSNGV